MVITGPRPDPDALGAMSHGVLNGEPLGGWMFARHHHVDVVAAAQAVIHDAQQAIRIGWQVDPDDLGLLVYRMIDEPRVLMGEAIMILAPDVARQKVVQRGDGSPPREAPRDLQPLRVLVEHRIDDVRECFVGVEDTMTAGQQVTLEPSLALMLA
jgi:hypothetical protein